MAYWSRAQLQLRIESVLIDLQASIIGLYLDCYRDIYWSSTSWYATGLPTPPDTLVISPKQVIFWSPFVCRTEYTNILPQHNSNRLVNKQSLAPTRRVKEYFRLDRIEQDYVWTARIESVWSLWNVWATCVNIVTVHNKNIINGTNCDFH